MISVVLPVYNGQKFIRNAIESVLEQTYTDWELIIVDDGSNDETANIVKKYLNDKVHYIYQDNQGPSSARNLGISIAKGDYIAFLDADDMYKDTKLEEQIKFLKLFPDIDIVYNDVQVVNDKLEKLNVLRSEGIYKDKEDFLAQLLFRQIIPLPPSMMLKRKCFEEVNFDRKYIHAEDYDLTIRLAKKFKFGYLPKVLYVYRRHGSNLTNSHEKQVKAEKKIVKNLGIEEIRKIVNKSTFPYEEKLMLLAKVLIKIGYYLEAIKVLNELTHRQIDNPFAYFYLGNCLYAENQLVEAEKNYTKVISYKNNLAEAYNNLGCVVAKKGNKEKARAFFKKALASRPTYMDALHNIKQLEIESPTFKLTERELRKTLTNYNN